MVTININIFLIILCTRCLVKNPEERATAAQLLQHEFIAARELSPGRLLDMINEARQMRERLAENVASSSTSASESSRTIISNDEEDSGTLVRHDTTGSESGGTMIQHATLVPEKETQTATQGAAASRTLTDVESYLSTMVVNEGGDEDEDTMKRIEKISIVSIIPLLKATIRKITVLPSLITSSRRKAS